VTAQFVNGSLESNVSLLLFVTSGCTLLGGLCAWQLPNDHMGTALAETITFDSPGNSNSDVEGYMPIDVDCDNPIHTN
jgi:hypothetical protein